VTAISTNSTPKKGRRPPREPRFLEVFRQTGNVRLATGAAGISREAPYKRAKVDPDFTSDWASAREDAIDTLEAEARRRALSASDTLLIFLLKSLRPDVYRENVRIDFRREAERLAAETGLDADEIIAEAERIARASR
jgi:hypothetical protein